MQIGMIGLGRMGANMVRRLMRGGHELAVHDAVPAAVQGLAREGAVGADSLGDLVRRLRPPRVVWLIGVPVHVLAAALFERFASQGEADFQDRVLSAMRFEFGGHVEKGARK